MGKRIIAVNAGPRKGWNTDTLIMEAAKGAVALAAARAIKGEILLFKTSEGRTISTVVKELLS